MRCGVIAGAWLAVAACRPVAPPTYAAPDGAVGVDVAAAPDVAAVPRVVTVVRVHYPAGARRVVLRGAAGPWTWARGVETTGGPDDTHTYTTEAVTAVTEYKPLLDDATWSRGPNYRVAPGSTTDVYPRFETAAGRVMPLFERFHSDVLGNDRVVWAYLPPTYLENARAAFPVVYMHDGQNLFDAGRAFGGVEWQVDEALDRGAEDGSIAEAIVVAPENAGADRIAEYTPTVDPGEGRGGRGELYLQMLATELRPRVEATLRTQHGPAATALVGSSLGGLISAWGGLHAPQVFGLIGALSPSTWWDNTVLVREVRLRGGAAPRALRVYVDSGDAGDSRDGVADTTLLAEAYADAGYVLERDLRHVVQPGGQHSEAYWAQRLPGALRFLLGPRAP